MPNNIVVELTSLAATDVVTFTSYLSIDIWQFEWL